MATSSILGGKRAPADPKGKDVDALGPSDSSDSGSDVQTDRHRTALPDEGSEGAYPIAHDSTTDAAGTGRDRPSEGRRCSSRSGNVHRQGARTGPRAGWRVRCGLSLPRPAGALHRPDHHRRSA